MTIDLKNKNIVVIYMLYFGDMVSLTPFLEVLRREAKGSHISLVIDSRFQDSVRYNPNVDTLIPVDRVHMGMAATWRKGREIGRTARPDLLFVLRGTGRTSLMALAMKPGCWIGDEGTGLDRFFMDQRLLIERRDCHATEKYLHALQDIGVQDVHNRGMQIYTSPEWDAAAERFYAAQGVQRGDALIGISVGSSMKEKNWPASRFGEVADYFARKGYRPVFFGVPGERPLIEEALAAMDEKDQAIVAAGVLSMGEFMAAASWCAAGFTNDSGPMYIFDSRGVPTIALFGPSNVKLHHPLGARSCGLSSSDLPMEQDHLPHTVRDGTYTPIDVISTDDVIRAGEWALGLREGEEYGRHYLIVGR